MFFFFGLRMQPNHNLRFTVAFFLGLDCQWLFVAMVISHESAEMEDSLMDEVQGLTMIQGVMLVLFATIFGELVQIWGFETCCRPPCSMLFLQVWPPMVSCDYSDQGRAQFDMKLRRFGRFTYIPLQDSWKVYSPADGCPDVIPNWKRTSTIGCNWRRFSENSFKLEMRKVSWGKCCLVNNN